jgi:hypothetical protein
MGLEVLLDLSPDLMCLATVDGYFRRVNPAFKCLNNTGAQWVSWITTITHHLSAAVPGGQCAVHGSNIGEQLSLRDRRRPGRRRRWGDAKFVEQSRCGECPTT